MKTPKPYRIDLSVWHPGKFVVKKHNGYHNLRREAQYKMITGVRFDSIAGAYRFLECAKP